MLSKLDVDHALYAEKDTELGHLVREVNGHADDEDLVNNGDFRFSALYQDGEHDVQLDLNPDIDLNNLVGKTVKFKLFNQIERPCTLVLDFIDADVQSDQIEFVYVESRIGKDVAPQRVQVDLREVVPELFCDLRTPYSVSCVRCNMDAENGKNRVTMDIVDDVLGMTVVEPDTDTFFNDITLLIEQGDSKRLPTKSNTFHLSHVYLMFNNICPGSSSQ